MSLVGSGFMIFHDVQCQTIWVEDLFDACARTAETMWTENIIKW